MELGAGMDGSKQRNLQPGSCTTIVGRKHAACAATYWVPPSSEIRRAGVAPHARRSDRALHRAAARKAAS